MQQENQILEDEELLQQKLDKLQKNRENVPLEDLRTKYAKPYRALLADIKVLSQKIMEQEMFYVLFPKDFGETGAKKLSELYEENKKALSASLFIQYSANEFIDILRKMHHSLMEEYVSWMILKNNKGENNHVLD